MGVGRYWGLYLSETPLWEWELENVGTLILRYSCCILSGRNYCDSELHRLSLTLMQLSIAAEPFMLHSTNTNISLSALALKVCTIKRRPAVV